MGAVLAAAVVAAAVLVGCGGGGDEESADTTSTTVATTTTVAVTATSSASVSILVARARTRIPDIGRVTPTTTTLALGDAISVEDPETGEFVTFNELVEMRHMVEVQTDHGPVWLDRDPSLADAVAFADGVAYMLDNCRNLAAADLERTEGIQALLLACLEDGRITTN
jgi:hypothetical protein